MSLIFQVQAELQQKIDSNYNYQYYFKEPIKALGVRMPDVRNIMKKYYPKDRTKGDLLDLCNQLLRLGYYEYKLIAFGWVYLARNKFNNNDFKIFENWLNKYVTNWGLCDSFVPYIVNDLLQRYPELIINIKNWTSSKKTIVRRASAVALLHDAAGVKPTKHKLEDVFWIASNLLEDKEDLVQKGYGWLLKNTSKKHPYEVFEFVIKNKSRMPRTALRYAVEKLPQDLRKIAMQK